MKAIIRAQVPIKSWQEKRNTCMYLYVYVNRLNTCNPGASMEKWNQSTGLCFYMIQAEMCMKLRWFFTCFIILFYWILLYNFSSDNGDTVVRH